LTTSWRPDRPSWPLGCGAYLFLGGLIVAFLILIVLLLPVPCPANCGPCEQLIGYTRLPGVTPEEATRILAYWELRDCATCGKRRRVTVLEALPYTGRCRD
jgi:hypothetical protein